MCPVDSVICIDEQSDIIIHLLFIGSLEFLVRTELRNIPGVDRGFLPLIVSV